eukprot:gene25769-11433_t
MLSSVAFRSRAVSAAVPSRSPLVIECAHKKGAGSTKNGRDSNSKSRGIKVYGAQPVKAGGIIVRQVGSTWNAGTNAGCGKDYTIFSTIDGVVIYEKKKDKPKIHVYPFEHEKAVAAVTASHTIKKKEGTLSRKERGVGYWTKKKAAKAGTTPELSVASVAVAARP